MDQQVDTLKHSQTVIMKEKGRLNTTEFDFALMTKEDGDVLHVNIPSLNQLATISGIENVEELGDCEVQVKLRSPSNLLTQSIPAFSLGKYEKFAANGAKLEIPVEKTKHMEDYLAALYVVNKDVFPRERVMHAENMRIFKNSRRLDEESVGGFIAVREDPALNDKGLNYDCDIKVEGSPTILVPEPKGVLLGKKILQCHQQKNNIAIEVAIYMTNFLVAADEANGSTSERSEWMQKWWMILKEFCGTEHAHLIEEYEQGFIGAENPITQNVNQRHKWISEMVNLFRKQSNVEEMIRNAVWKTTTNREE